MGGADPMGNCDQHSKECQSAVGKWFQWLAKNLRYSRHLKGSPNLRVERRELVEGNSSHVCTKSPRLSSTALFMSFMNLLFKSLSISPTVPGLTI